MFTAGEMCSAFEFLGLNHCATIAGYLCKIIFILCPKLFLFASFLHFETKFLYVKTWVDLTLNLGPYLGPPKC